MSTLKLFILINLFKIYFKWKLIPLRSKLMNAQKNKKKREKACETVTGANWAGLNPRFHNEIVSAKFCDYNLFFLYNIFLNFFYMP